MARGYMLDEVAIRKIVADHVKLALMYPTNSLVPEQKQYAERPPRRQRFLNSSGEECPAYAVMEVTAGVRGGLHPTLSSQRPAGGGEQLRG
jgi:hypothetical protein